VVGGEARARARAVNSGGEGWTEAAGKELACASAVSMHHEHLLSRMSADVLASQHSRVVILDLEVLAERQGDVEREFVIVGIRLILLHGESAKEQCERDREIEEVDGRLVENYCLVPVDCQETGWLGKDARKGRTLKGRPVFRGSDEGPM
jgi:hypothetical protein